MNYNACLFNSDLGIWQAKLTTTILTQGQKIYLCQITGICDEIKDHEINSSCITQKALNPMKTVLTRYTENRWRRRQSEEAQIEVKWPRGKEVSNYQRLEDIDYPLKIPGVKPCQHLDFPLWPPVLRTNVSHFKPPSL